MRYATKQALLDDIRAEHDTLMKRLEVLPAHAWREPGVWGGGWTVHDLLAHLAAWHAMCLRWFDEGAEGESPDMPAPGYKWSETPRLNRDIQAQHADRPTDAVRADFDATYGRILHRADGLSEAEVLEPGHFRWTGKNAAVTYLAANTASHYRFALKVLKRWDRQGKGEG